MVIPPNPLPFTFGYVVVFFGGWNGRRLLMGRQRLIYGEAFGSFVDSDMK
jgi:hypothetical protein